MFKKSLLSTNHANRYGLLSFAVVAIITGYMIVTARASIALPSDINNDGKVDVFDLSLLLNKWGMSGSTDINGDLKTDIFDLSLLLSHWGQTGPTPTLTPTMTATPTATAMPTPTVTATATPTSSPTAGLDPVGQPAGQWTMKFQDEFNATSVTTVDGPNGLVKFGAGPVWKAWYANGNVGDAGGHSNNAGTELEYYDISGLSVGSGALSLNAVLDNKHAGLPYTSGMIQSNPTFNPTYGYVEARMKSPAVNGSWPAFWMLPASYTWPPEIDIYENFADQTFYKVSNWGSGATVYGKSVDAAVRDWHVYGLKWTSNTLVFYLDGAVVATETNAASIPKEPMYLVLNLAVFNSFTQSFSAQVDYVRYWQ